MEALTRKPDLTPKREMELPGGTKIQAKGITGRQMMAIVNNKKLTDEERGVHITAAKILVDGQPVVYDDLLDGFSSDELEAIVEFANPKQEGDEKEKNV